MGGEEVRCMAVYGVVCDGVLCLVWLAGLPFLWRAHKLSVAQASTEGERRLTAWGGTLILILMSMALILNALVNILEYVP